MPLRAVHPAVAAPGRDHRLPPLHADGGGHPPPRRRAETFVPMRARSVRSAPAATDSVCSRSV
ncbi:hypothetical protein HBB16_11720 [Pseudonocardia sp. MCCB 268]|nr:hypothetical protein [Pseudonocardia cytotoxica]